jgi:hypothetical protein
MRMLDLLKLLHIEFDDGSPCSSRQSLKHRNNPSPKARKPPLLKWEIYMHHQVCATRVPSHGMWAKAIGGQFPNTDPKRHIHSTRTALYVQQFTCTAGWLGHASYSVHGSQMGVDPSSLDPDLL